MDTNGNRSSKRQRELLEFVDGFIREYGYGPSYREIMAAMGYKSVSTVAIHIDGLISKGYLCKRNRSARSLEVVTTRMAENAKPHTSPTPAQEKWLSTVINSKFDQLEEAFNQAILDELYVLIGTLKILELEAAHVAMRSRLIDYEKKRSSVLSAE